MVTVCLNMIVKNEAHIILSTLKMLTKYINYWIITDTGSTDDTVKIIKTYFEEIGMIGELYEDTWVDFGTNRTQSLQRAYGKCDYIFVFDADDLIVGDLCFPENISYDKYLLKFGKSFAYSRPLLFKSNINWIYKGVVHEFLTHSDKTIQNHLLVF